MIYLNLREKAKEIAQSAFNGAMPEDIEYRIMDLAHDYAFELIHGVSADPSKREQ